MSLDLTASIKGGVFDENKPFRPLPVSLPFLFLGPDSDEAVLVLVRRPLEDECFSSEWWLTLVEIDASRVTGKSGSSHVRSCSGAMWTYS